MSPAAPVNLVNLEQAVKSYGQRLLLDHVSAGVAAGDRIGVVGRNGAGKSTLLAVLAGTEQLDAGRVTRTRDLRIGMLAQGTELTGEVAQNVVGNAPVHVWAADPRTRSIMSALLSGIDLESSVDGLSGGEARRVALATVLTGDHDLLLLDEPTNHLDVEAIDWLARYLAGLDRAMVIVTHDRWFLDAVSDRTWELAGGNLHAYEGGYAAYVLARAERGRQADAAQRRRRGLLRKELAWLRRGPPARTSKPKFRIEAANELIAAEPPPRDAIELTATATARLGKTVLETEDLTVRVGPRVLLEDVTWQLGPGERVGLLGPNGSGKSTLLDLLAGQSGPEGTALAVAGRIIRGKTVHLGYLRQDATGLDPDLTAREAVAQVRGTLSSPQGEAAVSQLLDRLGLRGDTQWTPAGELSGGERRRLQLLRVLASEPNVLLFDEPTNDLDVDTLTELEDLLDAWPGSLLVVSHDRYFLERVTDHVVALLGDGQLAYLPGGVEEYLARQAGGPGRAPRGAAPSLGGRSRDTDSRQADSVVADAGTAEPSGSTAGAKRAARKELQRLERQIDRLGAREADLSANLAGQASDYEKLIELGAELREVQGEKSRLEELWLEAAQELSG
ncbi:MAG TPA: ABC-F family ATP-binding cassette domain-containing protein [Streptosporangiaceae bacterium]|jgi:ATP-binding cassette subfamily F protein uup|nr:ABC-F family ATP-binding cassette domain-containing protein [Streptosporangiaceae bacterium]